MFAHECEPEICIEAKYAQGIHEHLNCSICVLITLMLLKHCKILLLCLQISNKTAVNNFGFSTTTPGQHIIHTIRKAEQVSIQVSRLDKTLKLIAILCLSSRAISFTFETQQYYNMPSWVRRHFCISNYDTHLSRQFAIINLPKKCATDAKTW